MKNITIGIIAYNEEKNIETILKDLSDQTILGVEDFNIKVLVICNGCTDRTTKIATKILNSYFFEGKIEKGEVEILLLASKSNAWNYLVHHYSKFDSEYIFFLDADIRIQDRHCLERMLIKLDKNPELHVVLDKPVKDVEVKAKSDRTWMDKLSVAVSKSSNEGQLYICGQCYVARAKALEKIWMPFGLPVEDGFLTGVIISEGFTIKDPTFEKRIARVKKSSHIFKAYTNPSELIDHERRVSSGIVINIWLKEFFSKQKKPLEYLQEIAKDPNWLNYFVTEEVLCKGNSFLIPQCLLFRRFTSLKNHKGFKKVLKFPIACLAFLVDLYIFYKVNRDLRNKTISDIW